MLLLIFLSNNFYNNVLGLKPGYDYSDLDDNGLIIENTYIDDKKVMIGKISSNLTNPETSLDNSIFPKKGQLGYVDKTFITEGEQGFRIAKVRIRDDRTPVIGDKFCSRCGQKGTVGLVISEENMPFTDDGIRPDIIINPHALPSRMTIGQLLETVMGKTGCMYGSFGDCTAFINEGSKYESFGKSLSNIGFNSKCNEVLYNGETGEQMNMDFYMYMVLLRWFYFEFTHILSSSALIINVPSFLFVVWICFSTFFNADPIGIQASSLDNISQFFS